MDSRINYGLGEAFEKETVILNKRVQACKTHVVLSTCFDNKTSERFMGLELNQN